jgi:GT2 family glycosyltransferase
MSAAVTTRPRATVVIVNYNGEHLLGPCLAAVRAQTTPAHDFDVVVVDNASVDQSVALIEREHPWVRVIRSDRNYGFAGGNNIALRQLDTEFAVLLNTDTTVERDWLAALLARFDDDADGRVAAVTSKILFMPRFIELGLHTDAFRPGGADPRVLGVRVFDVEVDGESVADKLLWERLSYGPETAGREHFWWTRPDGTVLLPVSARHGESLREPLKLRWRWTADRSKNVRLDWPGGETTVTVDPEQGWAEVVLPAGVPTLDVINNAGGMVFQDGYGADRGYQQIDDGRFDAAEEVFSACGASVALRMAAARSVDWFDEDFFLYYEDTDLSWRLRLEGWRIWYEPRAVVRHIHSATSLEFSPQWTFYTDRNRLLMLTKDAPVALAIGQVVRYLVTTASMIVRSARLGIAMRRRPPLGHLRVRGRVLASFIGLCPAMVRRRRAINRSSTVPRAALRSWLVAR